MIELMEDIGFENVEFLGMTGVMTSKFTEGALFRAVKNAERPVRSVRRS